jgi:hypothetical protein
MSRCWGVAQMNAESMGVRYLGGQPPPGPAPTEFGDTPMRLASGTGIVLPYHWPEQCHIVRQFDLNISQVAGSRRALARDMRPDVGCSYRKGITPKLPWPQRYVNATAWLES